MIVVEVKFVIKIKITLCKVCCGNQICQLCEKMVVETEIVNIIVILKCAEVVKIVNTIKLKVNLKSVIFAIIFN